MKTIVYVDGFNLYYRALKKTQYKWLNLDALCSEVLPAECQVAQINYYTAHVSARVNPTSPVDQNTYLTALKTIPHLKVHLGNFQVTDKSMYLVRPLEFQPALQTAPVPIPRFAKVVKTEEKGSDVNLGVHLVRDAFIGAFEHAVIVTNDTDLKEPVRIVTQEAGLPVTLMCPCSQPAQSLRALATHIRHIRPAHLNRAQFPNPVIGSNGTPLAKPAGW